MPLYQGVIFQGAGAAGWSNVFYIEGPTAQDAMNTLDGLNTKLLALQGSHVTSFAERVSDVTVKGDSLLQTPSSLAGALGVTASGILDLNLAAHFEWRSNDLLTRLHHYVHGLRTQDGDYDHASNRTIVNATYLALPAVNAFITAVVTDCVVWRKRSIPPVTNGILSGNLLNPLSIRRVGRPFTQFRGRRRTA